MNSPPSHNEVGGFAFEFEGVSDRDSICVTHRHPVQLSYQSFICCDRVVRLVFVGQSVAVGPTVLAYSFSIVVISYVPWDTVEQAPHGLPRFTRDFRMV